MTLSSRRQEVIAVIVEVADIAETSATPMVETDAVLMNPKNTLTVLPRIPVMWRRPTKKLSSVRYGLTNFIPLSPDHETCRDGSEFHTGNLNLPKTGPVRATRGPGRCGQQFSLHSGSSGDGSMIPLPVVSVVSAESVWEPALSVRAVQEQGKSLLSRCCEKVH